VKSSKASPTEEETAVVVLATTGAVKKDRVAVWLCCGNDDGKGKKG
jgi:hypothetical protein